MLYFLSISKILFFSIFFYYINFIFNFFSFFYIFIKILIYINIIFTIYLSFTQISLRNFIMCASLINSTVLLIILLVNTPHGAVSLVNFLIFDSIFFLNFFLFLGLLININSKNNLYKFFCNLNYILPLKSNFMKFIIILSFLSISGLPPFGVFFLKYNILLGVLQLNDFPFLLITLFYFSLNFYYYLRLIKYVFFIGSSTFDSKSFNIKNITIISDLSYKKENNFLSLNLFIYFILFYFNIFFFYYHDFFIYIFSFVFF